MPGLYNAARLSALWSAENIQAWSPGYTVMKLLGSKSLGTFALAAQAVNGLEANHGFDVFKYVDPLIGTTNGGNYLLLQVLVLLP